MIPRALLRRYGADIYVVLVHRARLRQLTTLDRSDIKPTTFQTFERKIRDQLARVLNETDFDPARDIDAITVNRWPR